MAQALTPEEIARARMAPVAPAPVAPAAPPQVTPSLLDRMKLQSIFARTNKKRESEAGL